MRSKSMDWFLYDIGLHHERLKISDLEKKASKLVFLVNIRNASLSLIDNAPTFL